MGNCLPTFYPLKALRDILSFIMMGNVTAVTRTKARGIEHSIMCETVSGKGNQSFMPHTRSECSVGDLFK